MSRKDSRRVKDRGDSHQHRDDTHDVQFTCQEKLFTESKIDQKQA